MQLTQGIRRAVQIRAGAIATIYNGRRHAWREFGDRIARYAAGLKATGLNRGDRVAILAHNSDLFIETLYAVSWAGGISVPLNVRWAEPEHVYALMDCEARILVLDKQFEHLAKRLRQSCKLEHVIVLDTVSGLISSEAVAVKCIVENSQPTDDCCGYGDDLCSIFYTGGTTGQAKGVMLSHRNFISNFLAVSATAPTPADPIFLHSAPMFHMAGAAMVFATTLCAGTHVVLAAFGPEAVAKAIERERVTVALFVPTMLGILHRSLESRQVDFSSVERIRYGASPISETLLRDAMKMFPNAQFQQGYGQTELSPTATVLEPRFHHEVNGKSYLRSAGRAIIGTDVRIVDEDFAERPRGTVGEIVVRGPGVMLGYWNKPERTAETLVNGWVRTGDAGYMDEDGFVFVVDRLKDMIVSGGENVFSTEVENALYAHGAVAECAVLGVPDEIWGERVHAILRFKDNMHATLEDLTTHCKSLIAPYKCPRSFEVRREPLPVSAQGKILKSELRKIYWQGRDRRVG